MELEERVRVPIIAVVRNHGRTLVLATLAAVTTFVLFYLITVFTLSWGTSELWLARQEFLRLQMIGVLFLAATIPLSAKIADRYGRWPALIASSMAVIAFGLLLAPLARVGRGPRCNAVSSVGLRAHGLHLWTARNGTRRALSDGRPLYGCIPDLQLGRNPRRLSGTVHRHLSQGERALISYAAKR